MEMPAEVAFVPTRERTTITASTTQDPNTGDTIVVVGRKKDKKPAKKDRTKRNTDAPASTTPIEVGSGDDEGLAGFDFGSVPNILDDDDDDDKSFVGQKRGKKQKSSEKAKKAKGVFSCILVESGWRFQFMISDSLTP